MVASGLRKITAISVAGGIVCVERGRTTDQNLQRFDTDSGLARKSLLRQLECD